ncbi:hypothetical protein [Halolamina salifodinae]|uniref:Uncharacterized protein n=1 Tax=Halolamina salifodinae TaxID=1202767 RepID=A0A8T4GXU1_9EURY|nr:hypothetical protein [Halolamina salifodinae]MBP1987250.1 hypothetical protein [Halolamina salifodinae]
MLGNSSEYYIQADEDSQNEGDSQDETELEILYKKCLYISIHTLSIGIITLTLGGIFKLFPEFGVSIRGIDIVAALTYSLLVYYLITFSTVIATVSELIHIRVV